MEKKTWSIVNALGLKKSVLMATGVLMLGTGFVAVSAADVQSERGQSSFTVNSSEKTTEITISNVSSNSEDGEVFKIIENAITIDNNLTNGETLSERFEGIEEFGITFSSTTFNGGLGNVYYKGELVKMLIDDTTEHGIWISSSDDSNNDTIIRIIRDANGIIIGVEVV